MQHKISRKVTTEINLPAQIERREKEFLGKQWLVLISTERDMI